MRLILDSSRVCLGMFKKEIYTDIEIRASARRLWEVLTDFDSYQLWNPYIRRAIGEAKTGAQLEIFNQPSGAIGMTHRPIVVKAEPNHELRWLAHVFAPVLFKGEHIFTIESTGPNRVRLIHREIFTGLLVPFLERRLETVTRRGFEEMNNALKIRVEQAHATY